MAQAVTGNHSFTFFRSEIFAAGVVTFSSQTPRTIVCHHNDRVIFVLIDDDVPYAVC